MINFICLCMGQADVNIKNEKGIFHINMYVLVFIYRKKVVLCQKKNVYIHISFYPM